MPCNTVTTQSIALAKALPEIVEQTLKDLGWRLTKTSTQEIQGYYIGTNLTWTAGKGLTVRAANAQEIITKVTKAYSVKAVTWAAQKANWTVQQTTPDKLTLTKR